ncbi:MAG: hypothetical protein FWH19_04870 [Treponema sp.]|nr:hypothetical protein [Treponema sp.]
MLLVSFFPHLEAQNARRVPMNLYLIVDDSAALQVSKNEAIGWVRENLLDQALMDGDRISIWAASDSSQMIYSETFSAATRQQVLDRLQAMPMTSRSADFAGAMRDLSARTAQSPGGMTVIMLITGSAGGLAPALSGPQQELFRWFRSERYERWQVLVVNPDISQRIRQAADSFMNLQ